MHFVQAKTRLPDGSLVHWRFGNCFLLIVGLYFPALNLTLRQTIKPPFLQIEHCLLIYLKLKLFLKTLQVF